MRRWIAFLFAAVMLPAGAAAQRVPQDLGAIKSAPRPVTRIPEAQAAAAAVARVKADLARGALSAWGDPHVRIPSASVAAPHTLFNPTGGKDGRGVYVVEVTARNARNHVRVLVNPRDGAILGAEIASWDWGNAPDWWRNGEISAPVR